MTNEETDSHGSGNSLNVNGEQDLRLGSLSKPSSRIAVNHRGSFFNNYIGYALLYAFVLMIGGALVAESPVGLVPVFSGAGAVIFLAAAWSVLGPGFYWKRILIACSIATIPALGLCIPILGNLYRVGGGGASDFFVVMIWILPIMLGAQIPFWIMRSVCGWQLAFKGGSRQPTYSLQDIFVLTFLFAVCIASVQWSASYAAKEYSAVSDTLIQAPQLDANGKPKLDADGNQISTVIGTMPKSDEEIQSRVGRASAIKIEYLINSGVVFLSTAFLVLISLPILPRMFNSEKIESGCGRLCLYLLVVVAVLAGALIGISIFSESAPPFEIIFLVIFWGGATIYSFALGVWLPLLSSRNQGVQLLTHRKSKAAIQTKPAAVN